MPKDVDLTSDQPPKPSKDDLMARVTGQKKPGQPPKMMQTPPPAHLPGVKGNPPLPQGRPVAQRRPSSLTPEERAKLESIGWDDSMPIPKNMAQLFEQIQAEKLAETDEATLPLPVDPRTPKIEPPEAVPIDKLDAAKKEKLRKVLAGQVEAEAEEALDRESQQRISHMSQGLQTAYQMVANAEPRRLPEPEIEVDVEAGRKPPTAKAQPKPPQDFTVVADDDPDPEDFNPPPPPNAPAASKTATAQPPDVKATTETGAGGIGHTHCPHCMWDLRMPDVPEPPYHKKISFLHAILGQKCFTDEAELFGGSVVATFRALTTKEIDVVYKQAYRDRELGRAPTEMDFWERVNRYRLFLQLQGLRTTTAEKGFVHDLPDGLSEEANPMASSFWKVNEPPPGETVMPEIETFLIKNVLKTEAIFRVVNSACNQFNRMIAKMEAMVDNSDFWKPTEAQS